MKRMFALLTLLVASSGCTMLDDFLYDEAPPWYVQQTAEPAVGTCGQTIRNVNWSQTAEPELLR
jgi:hypothetical protein